MCRIYFCVCRIYATKKRPFSFVSVIGTFLKVTFFSNKVTFFSNRVTLSRNILIKRPLDGRIGIGSNTLPLGGHFVWNVAERLYDRLLVGSNIGELLVIEDIIASNHW